MPCICSLQLSSLNRAAQLPTIPFALPAGLSRLVDAVLRLRPGATTGTHSTVNLQLNAAQALNLNLPSFAATNLSAVASAASSATDMGIGPLTAGALPALSQLMASLNANLPALAPLSAINLAPLMGLSTLASLFQMVPNLLGINLTTPGAIPALHAALAPSANVSIATPNIAVQSLANSASAFGIDLQLPNGLPNLITALNGMAPLSLPALAIPQMTLTHLMGILAALANINSGFNINMAEPGAWPQLQSVLGTLPLNELAKLGTTLGVSFAPTLSANLTPPGAPANLNPTLRANFIAALGQLHMPSIGAISMMGSFLRSMSGLGVKTVSVPCAVCKILPRA